MGLENALEEILDENGCHVAWVLRTTSAGNSPYNTLGGGAGGSGAPAGVSIFTGYSTITTPTLLSALEASVTGGKIIGYTVNQQAGAAGLVAGDTGNGIALAVGESFTVNVDYSGDQALIVASTLFTPGSGGTQRIIWRYTIGPNIVPPSPAVISAYWVSSLTGGAPGVSITFDSSTTTIANCGGSPTYLWQYKLVAAGSWTTLSTVANPVFAFPVSGVYDVRLTVTCGAISNVHTKTAYISVVTALTGKFISVLGNNANAGTQAAPWKTFAYAMTRVVPGDTLYVLGNDGIFNTEWVRWTTAGTLANPITIKAYPGHDWRMDSNNFTLPNVTNTSAGGSYPGYGNKAASSFIGLFEVIANYVVVQDLRVLSSQGIGIKAEGLPGANLVGVKFYNIYANKTYKNSFRSQYVNAVVVDGADFSEGGYDAPWSRPVTTLNHPGCFSVKNGVGATLTNVKSHNHWGEAIIIGDNQNGANVHHCEFYDCMSPLGYINNCENVDFHHNLIYDSDASVFHADPSPGIYLNCEYLLATDINRLTNIRIWNNLVIHTGTSFRLGAGEINPGNGLYPPSSGIEIYNNSLFQSIGSSPKGITIHTNARITGTGVKLQYNLIYQTTGGVVGQSSTDPLITHWPNSWYPTPAASIQGSGDLYVNQLPINPNAAITAGAVNIANYACSAASPAKNVLAALNAIVTDDYSGNPRTSLYSFGAFE